MKELAAITYEGHDVIVVIVKKIYNIDDYDATVAAIRTIRGES